MNSFLTFKNVRWEILTTEEGTYTKHGPGSMDHPMDPVHGPGPWTTPNFLKEIASVNMKIYQRSRYEKHNTDLLLMSLRVCLVIAGCFGVAPR